ncbi:MAG: hypothetical protein KC609_07610, partial [Myxococcales bacterium]|nr:hypothetical protein [Myxococcales bacterium]
CALALFAIPRRAVAATIAERIFGEWRVVSLRVNDEEKPRRGEVSIVFQKNSIYIMYRLAGKRRSIIEGGAWSIYKAQLITVNHKHKTSTFSVRFDGENRLVLGFKTTKMTLARRKTSGREKPPSTKPLQIPTSR